jgi:hypothetical protein
LRLASLDSRLGFVHILFRFFLLQHPHEPVRSICIYNIYICMFAGEGVNGW